MQFKFKNSFINYDVNISKWLDFFLRVICDENDEFRIDDFLSEFFLNRVFYDFAVNQWCENFALADVVSSVIKAVAIIV